MVRRQVPVPIAPRMFMAARPTCSATSAVPPTCQPQAIHITLLARKSQKPRLRRASLSEATNHATNNVRR